MGSPGRRRATASQSPTKVGQASRLPPGSASAPANPILAPPLPPTVSEFLHPEGPMVFLAAGGTPALLCGGFTAFIGWTFQAEHTLLVTKGGVEILTKSGV